VTEQASQSHNGGGCGCVTTILAILVLWALFFGLTVNGKTLDIDIFPPAVRFQ